MDMRRALNKRTIIVIVVILGCFACGGRNSGVEGRLRHTGVHRGSQREVR